MAISLTSSGVVYSATQSPGQASGSGAHNTLDDYEEGTYTVGITGADWSVGNTTAHYTRIGRHLFFQWYSAGITFSNSSGSANLSGLPFTCSNATEAYSQFHFCHGTGVTGTPTGGHINKNNTTITFIALATVSSCTYTNGGVFYLTCQGDYNID